MSNAHREIRAAGLLVGHIDALTGRTITRVAAFTAYGLHGGTWIEWTTADGLTQESPAYMPVYIIEEHV